LLVPVGFENSIMPSARQSPKVIATGRVDAAGLLGDEGAI